MAWRNSSITVARQLRQLRLSTRTLRTQPRYDYSSQGDGEPEYALPPGLATPRQLVQYLDEFIVGQDNAKKVLSVAVFNHYIRVRANIFAMQAHNGGANSWPESTASESRSGVVSAHVSPIRRPPPSIPLYTRQPSPLFEKSNVLVLGPTGSGKTLLARTLAKVLDVPFSVSDATSFTQAGYVGEDVEMAIQRLLQASNWDATRASTGIVYIDEVDKIARKSSSMDTSRDVGGEGVQQALLRMMEGTVISIQSKGGSSAELPPPDATGPPRQGQRVPHMSAGKPDTYNVDTTNVLFILSGAFVGLDKIIKRRVAKGSIGFAAQLPVSEDETSSNGFMPFFTPNRRDKQNILDLVETTDLVNFGFIPEFISRMPSITTLAPLTVADLRRILTEVKGSLVSQYQAQFGYFNVEIRFTSSALDEICRKAAERGGGARGLRGIMESLLMEPMYEVPGSNVRHILIRDATVRGEEPPLYWPKGEGAAFWAAWAEEEAKLNSIK